MADSTVNRTPRTSLDTSISMTATAASIALRRGDHNRLRFAVQLCTPRYISALLEDLTETPSVVVAVLGYRTARRLR
jgi:hypothetical protein